jgi:hypothetical protein
VLVAAFEVRASRREAHAPAEAEETAAASGDGAAAQAAPEQPVLEGTEAGPQDLEHVRPPPPPPLVPVPGYETAPLEPSAALTPPAAPPREPVALPLSYATREWNLWELERRARERAGLDPLRDQEWSFLLMYLREFADADGILPPDFDPLVRESFAELIGAGR